VDAGPQTFFFVLPRTCHDRVPAHSASQPCVGHEGSDIEAEIGEAVPRQMDRPGAIRGAKTKPSPVDAARHRLVFRFSVA